MFTELTSGRIRICTRWTQEQANKLKTCCFHSSAGVRNKSSEAFCCSRERGAVTTHPEAYCLKFPNSANSEKQGERGGRNSGNKEITEEKGEHKEMKGRWVEKAPKCGKERTLGTNFLEMTFM